MNKSATIDLETAEGLPELKLVEPSGSKESVSCDKSSSEDSRDIFLVSKRLAVRLNSLGVSLLDRFSLVRIFRREFATQVAFFESEEGGNLTLEEAIEKATHKFDEHQRAKILERLLTTSSESISFRDLSELWDHSSDDAEFIWAQMKHSARQEFMSGHLAAAVFEPVDWMRSAWKRALFLGVRDSFLDEYQPEGGVEIALVDMMSQAHFLYLHWTEESIRRTRTDPRRENDEYRNWQWFKQETGNPERWEPGVWEKPYASELECQEQALKLADHFSRLFMRAVKLMDNHRLAKAKCQRLSLPTVRKDLVEVEHEHAREWLEKRNQARNQKVDSENRPQEVDPQGQVISS